MERLQRDEATGCWLWTGPLDMAGYGLLGRGGRGGGVVRAHRATYRLFGEAFVPGLELDHLCRNRRCCNPDHMEQVTHRENILRGTAPAAIHAKKTHCPKGHEYAGRNLRIGVAGNRLCRACDRDKKRILRNNRKEAKP